jgi:hypothetical protein
MKLGSENKQVPTGLENRYEWSASGRLAVQAAGRVLKKRGATPHRARCSGCDTFDDDGICAQPPRIVSSSCAVEA